MVHSWWSVGLIFSLESLKTALYSCVAAALQRWSELVTTNAESGGVVHTSELTRKLPGDTRVVRIMLINQSSHRVLHDGMSRSRPNSIHSATIQDTCITTGGAPCLLSPFGYKLTGTLEFACSIHCSWCSASTHVSKVAPDASHQRLGLLFYST